MMAKSGFRVGAPRGTWTTVEITELVRTGLNTDARP